jgi:adenosylhomocysteine nucleosidase
VSGAHVALLAPMTSELRPLVRLLALRRPGPPGTENGTYAGRVGGLAVTAMRAGVGTDAAARATRRVLDAGRVDHVVVVGIAGGIDDLLAIGDLVFPRAVVDARTGARFTPHPFGDHRARGAGVSDGLLHTSDDLIVDPGAVDELASRGIVALDMETAAVAAVCEERSCPWSVVRAVSDRASDGLVDEAVAGLARPDGSPDLRAVARLVARHPARVGHLARLGRDARIAARAAAEAAASAVRQAAAALDAG